MGRYGPDRGGPVLECTLDDPGDGSTTWASDKSVLSRPEQGAFGESTEGLTKTTAKMFRDGFVSEETETNPPLDPWPHSPR